MTAWDFMQGHQSVSNISANFDHYGGNVVLHTLKLPKIPLYPNMIERDSESQLCKSAYQTFTPKSRDKCDKARKILSLPIELGFKAQSIPDLLGEGAIDK